MALSNTIVLLLGLVSAVLVECAVYRPEEGPGQSDKQDLETMMALLNKPRVLDRHKMAGGNRQYFMLKDPKPVLSSSWEDCGASGDAMHLTSLTLSPDPIKIPGNVTLGFTGKLGTALQAPIEASITIQKKVVIWITVPCNDNVGSCDYPDVCQLLKQGHCPPPFKKYGIPCQCPFKPGTYTMPPTQFPVPNPGIPSSLVSGDYKVTVSLKQNGKEVGCFHMEFSLTD